MQCPLLCLLSCFHLKLEITCNVGLVPEAEGWATLVSCVFNLYSCLFGCCMPLVSASWNLYDFVRKALKASLSHCELNRRMFASHVSTGMSKFRMARWIPTTSPTPPPSFRSRWLSTYRSGTGLSSLGLYSCLLLQRPWTLNQPRIPLHFLWQICGRLHFEHLSVTCDTESSQKNIKFFRLSYACQPNHLRYHLCKIVTLVIRVVSWIFLLSLLNSWCLLLSAI